MLNVHEVISLEKDVFSSCHERGNEESNLKARSIAEPQRLYGERGLLRSSYDKRPAYR